MSASSGRGNPDWGGQTQDHNVRLSDLERRVDNIVSYGVVEEVDHDKGKARVRIGKRLSNWIPWTQGHADEGSNNWHPIQKGAQVAVHSPAGDPALGYIQPGLYWDDHRPFTKSKDEYGVTYADGSSDVINKNTKVRTITAPQGGSIVFVCGSSTLTIQDGKVTIDTPFLHVKGAQLVHNAKSISDTHKHEDVTPGNALTGVPT